MNLQTAGDAVHPERIFAAQMRHQAHDYERLITTTPISVEGQPLFVVPLRTRTEDDLGLVPPGDHTTANGETYTVPPCANGAECVALYVAGNPGNLVLRARAPDADSYVRETHFGVCEAEGYSCVLCDRYRTTRLVNDHTRTRTECLSYTRAMAIQTHRVNCSAGGLAMPETYHKDACFAWRENGLLFPMVAFDIGDYHWRRSEDGAFFVDQTGTLKPKSKIPKTRALLSAFGMFAFFM